MKPPHEERMASLHELGAHASSALAGDATAMQRLRSAIQTHTHFAQQLETLSGYFARTADELGERELAEFALGLCCSVAVDGEVDASSLAGHLLGELGPHLGLGTPGALFAAGALAELALEASLVGGEPEGRLEVLLGAAGLDARTILHCERTALLDSTVHEEAQAGAENAQRAETRQRKLEVLIVDAQSLRARDLKQRLRALGHRVLTTQQVVEASSLVQERLPDLVVLEGEHEQGRGLELCRALRAEPGSREVYVWALGRRTHGLSLEARRAGVDDLLPEGVEDEELAALLGAVERRAELRSQLVSAQRERQAQLARVAALTRELRAASLTDELTGLPNSRYVRRRLEQEWAASTRARSPLSVLHVDIDGQRAINQDHGFAHGDRVLRAVAHRLLGCTREEDVVARGGGQAFVVVCPSTGLEGAQVCAERVRSAMAAAPVEIDGEAIEVRVSVGVAARTPALERAEDLLEGARRALRLAKEHGGDGVALDRSAPDAARDAA